jgi:protocatechuate 3,4-dioxygenase, beta subunit
MEHVRNGRRDFLRHASMAALALPLLAGCKGETWASQTNESSVLAAIRKNALPAGGQWSGAIEAPADVAWRTVLATAKDEGEPMLISGTVYRPDGKTPAPNTLIYLYHTDMYGIYGRAGEHRHGRFRGWMLTDAKGRYEFRSIRPASYPDSTQSQHVHMTVTTAHSREDWIDSILFEGDRFITAREREQAGQRGGFQPIVRLEKGADGVMGATRDIRLMA